MKFRKKQIVVEAEKVSIILENMKNSNCFAQPQWIKKYIDENLLIFGENCLYIYTDEGLMKGDFTDYVICGVKGEIYPCKLDVFMKTYEPIYE